MFNYFVKGCSLFLIMCISSGCNSHNNKVKIEYYPDGNLKRVYYLIGSEKKAKEIVYYENGNIASVTNYLDNKKEGEYLNFFKEKGTLESKLLFKNDSASGVAYWFYESGSLKSSRNYKNDKEWYLGFDYWDDSFVVNKTLVRFDRNAKIYYKVNFDSTGKFVSEEGKQ